MSEIYVEELNVYPIKSCGPIRSESFEVSAKGLAYDREWVITRPNGTFISQRTNPELALVETALDGDKLLLNAPLVGEIAISLERDSEEETEIDIFKKPGTGTDEGDVAANYFSDYLGKPVRLFRNKQPRLIKEECRQDGVSSDVGFADGFPVLLASIKSLGMLNKSSLQPIDMARFRANIVINGDGLEAYEEDYWRQVSIGKHAGFHIVRACARCPMPNIDQSAGILPKPADRFVSAALKESRSGIDPLNGKEEVFFGQNLSPSLSTIGQTISVGDKLSIHDAEDSRNLLPISE